MLKMFIAHQIIFQVALQSYFGIFQVLITMKMQTSRSELCSYMNFFFSVFIFGCAGSSLLSGFSLVAVSRGYSSLWWSGFSRCGAQALGSTGSVVWCTGFSCSAAGGIFPDQGLNPCPLHWQFLIHCNSREVQNISLLLHAVPHFESPQKPSMFVVSTRSCFEAAKFS